MSRYKLGLLATLYLSQGLPYGFFSRALPALMRDQKASLEAIGLSSLLFLPWALKFLWAPWVDRYGSATFGMRKSWIVPLQLSAAAVMASMACVEPANLTLLLVAVMVTASLAATQDIATDGLAVDLLSRAERGMGNAVQVGAYRVGMIIGGGLILIFIDDLGWGPAFWLMGGLLVVATIPIARHAEAPPLVKPPSTPTRWEWRAYLAQPGAAGWLLALVLYKGLDALANKMIEPMMIDAGYDLGDIGAIVGTAGSAAALLGALCGGLGVRALGRRRALIGFGVLQALAVAAYAVPALGLGGDGALIGVVCADSLLGSMATTALFTVMMDTCRPGRGATDYTIQASVVVIAVGVMSALSGFVASAVGYPVHFALTGIATGLALWGVVPLLARAPGQAAAGSGAGAGR